jgi:hypothetical protein
MDNPAGLSGQTIGKYRIVEHLGRGGMAEVYKAYQPNLDRYVALKLMHAFLAADQDFIARFEREAKNVAALRHPNIVQVYDFDVHNGTPYMVMEYIEGGTLKSHLEDLVRDGKQLSIAEGVHTVREVGKALSYAHSHQMIHRDVKPANVLLEVGGRVILTDFGIAKILTGPSYTVTGATIGTPAYMSPEQGLGRPGDHRSDIYALGVMLYQLATGQLPYEADTPLAVMLKHVNEPLPLPRTFKPDIPEGLERIILKAMAKNPDDRFQSADEMLAQLGDLDTAQMLVIPPASMAAGAAAHASTVAMPVAGTTNAGAGAAPPNTPADATRIASAAGAPVPAGSTVIKGTGAAIGPGAAGVAVGAAMAPPAPVAAKRSGIPIALVIGFLILALLALGGGVAFAFTGGFGLLPKPSPTVVVASATTTATATIQPSSTSTTVLPSATLPPAGSATPDLIATQLKSIQETQSAIQASVATATPTNTPNLTATAAACTYGYKLAGQQPDDGKSVVVAIKITKVLTLTNTGVCPFQPGTVLSETSLNASFTPISFTVPTAAPQATAVVSFDWPARKTPGSLSRSFVMLDPKLTPIGQPLTFTLKYILGATPIPPPTATNPPPAATDTPAPSANKLTDLYPASYISCSYVGDNHIDYLCSAILGRAGGVGPFTLYVSDQRIGSFQPGEAIHYDIRWRRCGVANYSVRLVDDGSVSEFSKGLVFDPAGNASLFPGGGCTPP